MIKAGCLIIDKPMDLKPDGTKCYSDLTPFLEEKDRVIKETEATVKQLLLEAEEAAERMLNEARQEAEDLVAKAKAEAQQIQVSARAEGYEQGLSEATERAKKEKDKIIARANKTQKEAEQQRVQLLTQAEGEIVELAVSIAQRLVNRQLDINPETINNIAETLLAEAKPDVWDKVVIYVNELSLAAVEAAVAKGDFNNATESTRVAVDNNLDDGNCVVITPKGRFETNLEEQLKKIENGLKEVALND
ncbi:FliH/SctL family protein [Desulfitispora alkaliphila]|uniref:FliH/SctL family protein n=1 Tax=Desulfitispora alkaliphila TaxID=622674 RepID=UPI003D21C158